MRSLIFPLCVVTLIFISGLPSADAQWRGAKKIDGAGQAHDLSMVVSGNNHYVMFHTFLNNDWTSYLAASNDGGRSPWSRQALSFRKWPRFDAVGDLVVIAEGEQGPGGGHGGGQPQPDKFWVEISRDGGQTYSTTQLNSATLFDLYGYPAVKIDGDRVYLHWSEDGGVKYLQVSHDRGMTWLAQPLTIPVTLVHELFEVTGDSLHGLVIGEQGGGSSDDQLVYQRSIDGGLNWTTKRIDNDRAGTHGITQARLTLDGGRITAMWDESYVWNERDIYFSTSTDNGTTWSPPLRLNEIVNPRSAVAKGFDLAATGDALLIAYTQQVPFGNNVVDCYARYSSDGGGIWTASKRVNPIPSSLGYPMAVPHCAVSGDRGVVTWIDAMTNPPAEVLMGAATTNGGLTWSAKAISGGSVWEGEEYALAYDHEGAVGAAFERTNAHAYANAIHQPYLEADSDLSPGSLFDLDFKSAGASDEGSMALIVLSGTGDGSLSGGITLPGSGGRKLLLDFDPLTLLGISSYLSLFVTGPITGGSGSTPSFTVPANANLGDVWAAGVVLKGGQVYGALTDTLKIN